VGDWAKAYKVNCNVKFVFLKFTREYVFGDITVDETVITCSSCYDINWHAEYCIQCHRNLVHSFAT